MQILSIEYTLDAEKPMKCADDGTIAYRSEAAGIFDQITTPRELSLMYLTAYG